MMTFFFLIRMLPAMFDFLFKRTAKKPVSAQPATPAVAAPLYDARSAARHRAEALQHDEAGSLAFLLQCEYAEARLIAAQAIVSKAALQQVLDAMRNSDRRVARLMQARFDVLQQQDKLAEQTAACSADAERLAADPRLTPNQVSELDRRWQKLLPVPESMQQVFDVPRAALTARLLAQAELQRAVIDALAALRTLREQALALPIEELRTRLGETETALDTYRNAAEIAALPRHLLGQCTDAANALRENLSAIEQQHAARRARCEILDGWDAVAPATLQVNLLRREWQNLPSMTPSDPTLQERFDRLLERVVASQPTPATAPATPKAAVSEQKPMLVDALRAMETALEHGLLQAASDADKRIRSLDLTAQRPEPALTAQLSRLRAELGRLQGWARWGGNISREELQKAAEALPSQHLAVAELAKKIGSLRERWKTLDVSAGPAPKELWSGFDAACTSAYAPVAEHFEKLAAERQKNAALATELIADIHRCADALAGDSAPDWKVLAQFCQRSVQIFQRLGSTDRREKKRLDSEFNTALQRLREPLAQVRDAEIRQREQLIAEALALSPTDRSALDTLKALQERWQERARSLALERNDEQALWVQFRAACDAVFAKRKEVAVVADAERREHLQVKEALCATLEAAAAQSTEAAHPTNATQIGPDPAILLRQTAETWGRTGPVPRAAEAALDARYRQAVTLLTQQVDSARLAQRGTALQQLRSKLTLCQRLESALAAGEIVQPVDQTEVAWQALGADSTTAERALRRRFERVVAAQRDGDASYTQVLESNRGVLLNDLLRLEIVLSLDSPTALARERLQLQVEVLQAALKSGAQERTDQARLDALCALPALLDSATAQRLERIVARLAS